MRSIKRFVKVGVATIVALAAIVWVTASPLQAYRTKLPNDAEARAVECSIIPGTGTDDQGHVRAACADRIVEHATNYELHFAEFDDQGFPFPENAGYGDAGRQVASFLARARELTAKAETGFQGVSLVVFVHGWKHSAQSEDSNVRAFRALLSQLAVVERETSCMRNVVGLYVGWRGAGTRLPDMLENLTFWNRKDAAVNVSHGSIREVLSSLRAMADLRNKHWHELVERARNDPDIDPMEAMNTCEKRVRLTIVGHSFGGLIVHSALSQSLIRDMAELREAITVSTRNAAASKPPKDPVLRREGDLVVVINPAVEAARFDPLFRVAANTPNTSYHAPLFVAITSADDSATKYAFPLGRWLSHGLSAYPEDAGRQRTANLTTMGHDQHYITHRLTAEPESETRRRPDDPCITIEKRPFEHRLWQESSMLREFIWRFGPNRDANAPGVFPRAFCTRPLIDRHDRNYLLSLDTASASINRNSPVWNVLTSSPIVNDHNDLTNPRLVDFLRQLYIEAAVPVVATNPPGPPRDETVAAAP